jgi:hypothetical protein
MNFDQWFQVFSQKMDFLKWFLGTIILGGFLAYINHVIQKKKLEIEELKHLGTFKEIVSAESPERAIKVAKYFEVLSPGKDHQKRWRDYLKLLNKEIIEKRSKNDLFEQKSHSAASILRRFESLKDGRGDHPKLIERIENYLSYEDELLKSLFERNLFLPRINATSEDRVLYSEYLNFWKKLIDVIQQIKIGRDVSYRVPQLPNPSYYPDYPEELLKDINDLMHSHKELAEEIERPVTFIFEKLFLSLHTKVRVVITTMNFVFGFRMR